jgi:hypothetical protein
MNRNAENDFSDTVRGHLLHLGERHQVAIYARNGMRWVAEFREGRGELIDAATWFHFHAGALRYSHGKRAAALESATALTQELLEEIERLHQTDEHHRAQMADIRVGVLESLKRYFSNSLPRFTARASKRAQRFS